MRHCFRLGCLVCLVVASMATPALAAERLALPDTDRASMLASVLSFYHKAYAPAGPEIKIFEIGGGDPAMNGAFIYVCIEYHDTSYVWKTGLNVRQIERISFIPGNGIALAVKEDIMDGNGAILSRKKTYVLRFYITRDTLQNRLTVDNKEASVAPGASGGD